MNEIEAIVTFTDRVCVVKLYEQWLEVHPDAKRCELTFLSYLQLNGILNVKAIETLLENHENRSNQI